jgi:hypothetical protein
MGAGANQPAFEGAGHGFMTTGLLMGIRETLTGDELFASEWLKGAQKRTKEIASMYGYKQFAPGVDPGDTLKVAVFPNQEVDCIPDLSLVPLLGEPEIRSEKLHDTELEKRVRGLLSQTVVNPSEAPAFYYLGTATDEKHIQVDGTYTQTTGHVSLELDFQYDDKGKVVQLSFAYVGDFDATQKAALAEQIVKAIREYAVEVWQTRKNQTQPMPQVCGVTQGAAVN